MLQSLKKFLWIALLVFGLQTSWAYSLLGPVANGSEDTYQQVEIGYNPMTGVGPPFFGDLLNTGPKNIGEGYRLNTPVLYYTFDPSFDSFFGSDGEVAVRKAFDIMNSLTNVDNYSTNLSEFPLNSQGVNFQARALGIRDLKSTTLQLLLEQMGLADSVRYTWALFDRYNPPGSTCPQGGPANGYTYEVIQRNYDITATPLNFNAPDVGQYSPYVNGELYTYFIFDNCDAPGASPGTADAIEFPVDRLTFNPPVASGLGEDGLPTGSFYNGLTRDDVAGLRYLMSSNNVFAPGSGYLESSAGGSVATSGGGGATIPEQITTFNLSVLQFEDPNTLQTLVPNIVITSVTTNVVNGVTTFTYTFGNVVTNSFSTNTTVQILTTNIAPVNGAPIGSPAITNVTLSQKFQTNLISGDFFVVPTNSCGITVVSTVSTNVTTTTNTFLYNTNTPGQLLSESLIVYSTNHVLSVLLCTNSSAGATSNSVVGDFQGIERVQFVPVADNNYDYLTAQFITPITNQYTMVKILNGQASTVTFQRVVTRPDIIFLGANLSVGGNDTLPFFNALSRTIPNFINSRTAANFSGPGIIDPTTSPITITFNTIGPVFNNASPALLSGPGGAGRFLIWGSFDATTNAPIVYPNGTSLANLAAEALFQISPTTLPNGSHGVSYHVVLSVTGGRSPYTWSLASTSGGLPAGLNLSSSGVISGTPTQGGTFDVTVQVNDSSARSVQMDYSITIN